MTTAPDRLGGALYVGELVAPCLLPCADEKACELRTACAGLRQQFRQRDLQQFPREQEPRFERHGHRRGRGVSGIGVGDPGAGGRSHGLPIEEPCHVLTEHGGQHTEHRTGRDALAGLYHAQVGHRRRVLRVDLHAARREFLEGKAVPFAQTAQAGAEEVALA